MKCRAKNCLHENKDIPIGEEVLSGKSAYYHKDCFRVKTNIEKAKDMFVAYVSTEPIYNQLQKVLDSIVYEKGKNPVEQSEFLVFALTMYMKQKKPLNYPAGIKYVIKNEDIIKEWNKKKNKISIDDSDIIIEEDKERVNKVEYNPIQRKITNLVNRSVCRDD
jgi:hypothetical protein